MLIMISCIFNAYLITWSYTLSNMLTKIDLEQIGKLLKTNNIALYNIFATKQQLHDEIHLLEERLHKRIAITQEAVLYLKKRFDMEFTLGTNGKVDRHEDILQSHERRIGDLEAEL